MKHTNWMCIYACIYYDWIKLESKKKTVGISHREKYTFKKYVAIINIKSIKNSKSKQRNKQQK